MRYKACEWRKFYTGGDTEIMESRDVEGCINDTTDIVLCSKI